MFLYWFSSGDVCLQSQQALISKVQIQTAHCRRWEMCGLRFAETSITKSLLLKLMFWTTSFQSQSFRCHWLFTMTCINSPSLFKCHTYVTYKWWEWQEHRFIQWLMFLLNAYCSNSFLQFTVNSGQKHAILINVQLSRFNRKLFIKIFLLNTIPNISKVEKL